MNKPYMHTNIMGIPSFQNGLNQPAFLRELFEDFGKVLVYFAA